MADPAIDADYISSAVLLSDKDTYTMLSNCLSSSLLLYQTPALHARLFSEL
jgi:hypothetical protein